MCIFYWKLSAVFIIFEVFVSITKAAEYSNADYVNDTEKFFENYLFSNSIVFGLAKIAKTYATNVCYKELKIFETNLRHQRPWAMKALDASGSKRAGFVFGQNYWLGSREACEAVQEPIKITLSERFERKTYSDLINDVAPFSMEYRVVYMRHNSPWQIELRILTENIIHIGLCVPASCNSSVVKQLTAEYFKGRLNIENALYKLEPEVLYVKDLKLKKEFYQSISFRLMCISFSFTSMMIICAFFSKRFKKTADYNNKPSSLKIRDFIVCFDIKENCKKLYAQHRSSANEISVINGMRTISAFWITIFHVMFFLYFTTDNKPFGIAHMEFITMQVLAAAPLHVDMFFTVSGFLQTRNFLRNSTQMKVISNNNFLQNLVLYIRLLFHRCMRLAPLYYITICLVTVLGAYINDVSVFHIDTRMDILCTQHLWRSLLFVQNFFDHRELCMNWTWSLACDMEFYVLATVLLFIYAKYPTFIKNFVLTILASNILWTYFKGISTDFQFSLDVSFDLGTDIYINPFIRILPYVLGAISAWFIFEKKDNFSLSSKVEAIVWNLALFVLCCSSYMMYWRNISPLATSSIIIFGRIMLSLAICWIIIATVTGRSCWWSRILESSVFQHTQRLCYAIYLSNPFVIIFVGSTLSTSLRMEPIFMFFVACGFCVMVYVISVVFSLTFEIPYCNWSNLMLKQSKAIKSK